MIAARRRLGAAGALAATAVAAALLTPAEAAAPAPAQPLGTSQWGCSDWGMLGRTLGRTFANECAEVITPDTVRSLAPAWTFRPPPRRDVNGGVLDQTTFTASPTVVGGVVYIGGWDGFMYALDADDGSVRWQFEVTPAPGATYGPIVSSAAVARVRVGRAVRQLVVFGAGPRLYALDAATGTPLWVRYFGTGRVDEEINVESSPAIWNDTVYVGRDVHNQPGERTGGVRGGLMALDAATGRTRFEVIPELLVRQPASGCGGVWGSPVVEPATSSVYFGTANCPAVDDNPRLPMESVYKVDASTGALRWRFVPHAAPDQDEDFGATPNLYRDAKGRTLLGAASKDGSYYALDPATGRVLWNTAVTEPAPGVGGFIGAPAVWRGRIFGATAIGSPPAYHSLDGTTGAVRWQHVTTPSYAASAATGGVVLAGALDGVLKAYDAESGSPLWASPALGAISSAPALAGDLVVVGSGTSTSDACAKGRPGSELCFLAFDAALGQQGGVHAFRLVQ